MRTRKVPLRMCTLHGWLVDWRLGAGSGSCPRKSFGFKFIRNQSYLFRFIPKLYLSQSDNGPWEIKRLCKAYKIALHRVRLHGRIVLRCKVFSRSPRMPLAITLFLATLLASKLFFFGNLFSLHLPLNRTLDSIDTNSIFLCRLCRRKHRQARLRKKERRK